MSEEQITNMIKFKIPPSTRITFIATFNGEVGHLKIVDGKIFLLRGRVYKIPVNTDLKLDDHYILKIKGSLKEFIDVRNIEDGIATVIPLIHNVVVTDDMDIGHFV